MHPLLHPRFVVLVLALLFPILTASARTLKITSSPAGATIELNGEVIGTTPFLQDYPHGYFQRPLTMFEKSLQHPMIIRVSLSGYVTQQLTLTEGPRQRMDSHNRPHGQYWLLKSDRFFIELAPLPPDSPAASNVKAANHYHENKLFPDRSNLAGQNLRETDSTSTLCPLPLLPSTACASIPPLRRADQGFTLFSFAPLAGPR